MSRRTMALVAMLAALGLVAAPTAGAAKAKLGGGTTTLKLKPAIADALTGAGVSVAPVKPAKAGKGGIAFPITGGKVDPASGAGRIDHSGGLTFAAGGKKVKLTSFRVHVGAKGALLTAKAGKARIPALRLSLANAKLKRTALGLKVTGVQAALTATAAGALNATFGVSLFSGGLVIGGVSVDARTARIALRGGATTLALDPGAASALQSLGVTAAPVDPATAGEGGIAFPITGGKLNGKTFAGSITHSGGLALSAGSTRVELTDFTINVDGDPDLTALVGGTRVSILTLDLSGLTTAVKGRQLTIGGVKASLTAAAAGALNDAFHVTAFTEGLVLGTATVSART